ncbi:putative leucine-rich repeat-containing protein DDB_G0290503 [Ruditapes philippinarum]|uniref:putative leucine-rich repeat-containing protein DDB_G0290503 n=1 Tax=Ruditapes philippinarum TaxID=129788 RepID=UPI00295BD72E|nr:putative leucine-rich repeat-containing protein DDB_G0290503 [Ruditapes philippinarum]
MSQFLSLSIGLLLSLFCQVTCAEPELSAKVVYQLLSMRIDNVVRENNNLKSELKETKADVGRLENKIESMEVNISLMASKAARIEDENSKTLLSEKIHALEQLSASRLQKKFKTEAIVLRKMLVSEKSQMKDKLMAFEQKFKSFQSELVDDITIVNTTVDSLENSISEQNIAAITMLVAVENKLQSQLNETDLLMQEMNKDLENRLIESDARMKDRNMKLAENINEVDQRLIAAKSNLQSTYNGLNNRLNSAESQLQSVSSMQDRQEDTFSNQISTLSSRISVEEARKVAFSARLTKKQSYYVKNERIVFDEVFYNHGGGYSSSTGIFTAPKSGTYLFTYNIQSSVLGDAHVVLKVNWLTRTSVVVDKGADNNSGNSGIGYVRKGEKVWLATASSDSVFFISPYRTTFNGILID